jgi:hypothetical protein
LIKPEKIRRYPGADFSNSLVKRSRDKIFERNSQEEKGRQSCILSAYIDDEQEI